MIIPSKTKTVSLILKAAVVICAISGVILSAAAAKGTFMSGKVFMFFTIQSNVAVALICAVGAALMFTKTRPGAVWPVVVLAGTVSITLTGAVFTFMLAPTLGDSAWNIQNVLTHVTVPAAAVADFLLTGAYYEIKKKHVFWVILPPGLYALYAGIGYIAGWEFAEGYNYPYFFLNWGSPAGAFGFTNELPFMGCAWWILLLLLLLIGVGFAYLAVTGAIGKRIRKAENAEEDKDAAAE